MKAKAIRRHKEEKNGNIEGLDIEPWQIARKVREGIRTKEELYRCGCKNCRAALEILEEEKLKEGVRKN